MKRRSSLCVIVLIGTIGVAATSAKSQTSQPAGTVDPGQIWRNAPKVAPFQAVLWQDQVPEVRVKGIWYDLVSLDDLPADQIVAFAQSVDSENWHKRIEQDLPGVLILMGHKAGPAVKLTLKDLATGNVVTMENVQMTEANRRSISKAKTNNSPFDPNQLWRDGAKVAPFQAVRWRDQVPEVRVGGTWYELVSLNDLAAGKIVQFSQTLDADHWQQRFEEDLPALLTIMTKQKVDSTVKLTLKDLVTGNVQTLEKVEMTQENRQAIYEARMATTKPAASPAKSTGETGL
jgi:hypothetical protein